MRPSEQDMRTIWTTITATQAVSAVVPSKRITRRRKKNQSELKAAVTRKQAEVWRTKRPSRRLRGELRRGRVPLKKRPRKKQRARRRAPRRPVKNALRRKQPKRPPKRKAAARRRAAVRKRAVAAKPPW